MKLWQFGLQLIVALVVVSGSQVFADATADASCECPKLNCGPCEQEQGMTFYTEKCGKQGERVRSCSRPTCVAADHGLAGCQLPKKEDVAKSASGAGSESDKTPVRGLASAEVRGAAVAAVRVVRGEAFLRFPEGTKQRLTEGVRVYEKDTIVTGAGGQVQLEFDDGNKVHIHDSTQLKVQQYVGDGKTEVKRAVLDLIRGKVRNEVKQKYNGETSSYRVRTRSAVAGVRGTDFVVTHSESDKVVTKVETLVGQVELSSLDNEKKVDVGSGQNASYVVAANKNNVFSDEEMNEFVARGYMTPVFQMSASEVKKLAAATEVRADKTSAGSGTSAATDAVVCHEPQGAYNHCLWTCVVNPKGESKCRTDLPEVSCVRKRCNANGEWAEETRLPASFEGACTPSGQKIAPCDY